MAENPLLPHRKLMELYELMKRLQQPKAAALYRCNFGAEAVLAAVLVQLEPHDIFTAGAWQAQLPGPRSKRTGIPEVPAQLPGTHLSSSQSKDLPRLVEVLARGLKSEGAKKAAVCIISSEEWPTWAAATAVAHEERLPLIAVVLNDGARNTVMPAAKREQAPVPSISVDGEDAVALFRVCQESLHRAKQGDGPAVVWCSFPSSGAAKPLATLEDYLALRGLGPKAKSTARTTRAARR